MGLLDFDYNLPKELIAQHPSEKRDGSRLLVLHKNSGKIEHRIFSDIVGYFQKGDLLVLNNTKVVPARLTGKKETGGRVEALILAQGDEYEVLLKPARGCKVGTKLIFGDGALKADVSRIENGRRFLKFQCNGDFEELLDRFGKVPLPPYIKRDTIKSDRERYQTVYAEKKGAIAAPTAGLHFTKEILSNISAKGIDVEYITLHVGYGTFKPVKSEDITAHKMEKEYFEIDNALAEKLKTKKVRTIAVGTTTCRALETVAARQALPHTAEQTLQLQQGWTDLFMYPPYKFKAIDALLTNFHLPRTTLLMLVSAFCGRELLMRAYEEAVREKYRFYSYGDAMLII
ncbi:MAG: tRNA preQ1(34) S-adenosylmethionine ribosyltransferase-isomerase QueA [Candidatus Omnitrophica bacterium]|nr:tRNA preQ1(34) S-adenosylmethionine ribosyltransferase-isomerase QueA [Candidatus Omnitrophota bacterium]MBU4149351.1 tRNA preQ1(34) S-adenosylmethionine ribosyltransferase-isomerase QueA [Candidatus Omnitrophota bacterium]